MPFYKLLDQERTPVYTGVAALVTFTVEILIFLAANALPGSSFGAIGIFYLTALVVLAGVFINVVLGSLANRRGEYWGGRIAAAGIVVWLVTILGFVVPPLYRAREEERSGTWGAVGSITDVIIQGDGKIVLLGAGMVRLLPDGQPDPSFHGDYSFKKGGSLPGQPRNYWPTDGCAINLPNGDLLFASNGRIARVLVDGHDGPSFSVRPAGSSCWGMAVQSDGSVLAGWAFGPGGSRFSRNLPDGSADPKFQPAVIPWFRKGEIDVQPTGKILLAGWVRSADRIRVSPVLSDISACFASLTRLNPDGNQDESFHAGQQCRSRGEDAPAPGPGAFAVLNDGSMLVASNASHMRGISVEISHVDSSGNEIRKSPLRGTLQNFTTVVSTLVPMNDGRILVGGQRSPTSRGNVEKLLANGGQDPSFQTHGGFLFVQKILLQGEKILVLDGNGHLSRLNSDGSSDPTFQVPVLKVYSH